VPDQKDAKMPAEGVSWNYTTWLNIAFLLVAAALVARFIRTGGLGMLRMMGGPPPDEEHGHGAHQHDAHQHDAHQHTGRGMAEGE
jgi:uncharacterized protein